MKIIEKEHLLKLPICEPVREGAFMINESGERIEEGDIIQIIAPKSRYHNMICIFAKIEDGIEIWYNKGGEYPGAWANVNPGEERLTWEDFKFVKYKNKANE